MISSLKFGVHNSGLYEPRICALSDQLTEMCTFNYTGTPFLGRPVSPFNTFGADEARCTACLYLRGEIADQNLKLRMTARSTFH